MVVDQILRWFDPARRFAGKKLQMVKSVAGDSFAFIMQFLPCDCIIALVSRLIAKSRSRSGDIHWPEPCQPIHKR